MTISRIDGGRKKFLFSGLFRLWQARLDDTPTVRTVSDVLKNREKVEAMVVALLEWETLDAEQINDIMEGRPPRAPKPPPITSAFGNSAGGAPGPAADNAPAPA